MGIELPRGPASEEFSYERGDMYYFFYIRAKFLKYFFYVLLLFLLEGHNSKKVKIPPNYVSSDKYSI